MDDEEASRRTFELLANETRLGIISALGEASGEGGYATLAFSELQAATGVEDNGHFNYHLKKLVGEFIEEREGGYALTLAGIRAYQAIVTRQSKTSVRIDPFDLGGQCDSCGGNREAWYENGRAYLACKSCGEREIRYPVSSTQIDPEEPESVLDALDARLRRDYHSMFNGLCPYCTGPVVASIQQSSGHWEETDMRSGELLVHAACKECGWFLYANLAAALRSKEPVQEFYLHRGVDLWAEHVMTTEIDWIVDSVDRDPVRVCGHFNCGGNRLEVEVGEDIELIEYTVRDADG